MSAFFIAKILQHFFENIEVNKETLDKLLNTPQFRMKASFNIDIRRRYKWGECPDEFTKSGTMIRVHLQIIKNLLPENRLFY